MAGACSELEELSVNQTDSRIALAAWQHQRAPEETEENIEEVSGSVDDEFLKVDFMSS